ncbi:hypothetical protein KHA80_21770 [Anaerobacillus sp. HL2]|nr:hypothetical protein KHA80_21770 [Anaerobacillus sp. HL2]
MVCIILLHIYQNVEVTTKVIIGWNYQTQLAIANIPHVYFVPMYDLFQGNLDSYLSKDRFHPNKEGYEQMAN